jgi:hypothetical protein
VNATLMSTTDPDAPCVRQNKHGASGDSRPRYKQHRAVDDRCGVITAVVTTPGDVPEPAQAEALLEQHEHNTGAKTDTVVGDQQYGTTDLHRRMQQRGVRTHLKCVQGRPADADKFGPRDFVYDEPHDRYQCPAGQWLYRRHYHPRRQQTEYITRKGVCAACALRSQCTTSKHGRTLARFLEHELVLRARDQARSPEARADYARRRSLMEGSFAQSANCHGLKRARWRRLWRQQIQDLLIAACQNAKILTGALKNGPIGAIAAAEVGGAALSGVRGFARSLLDALRDARDLLRQSGLAIPRLPEASFQLN